jgi:hypothetical protein
MRVQPQHELSNELTSWPGPDGVTFELAKRESLIVRENVILLDHWLLKAAGRVAPKRAEISARDIPTVLRSLHLYDVQDGGRAFRLRLVGTQLVDAVGSDPTGKVVTANDSHPMYKRVFAALPQVLKHRAPIRMTAHRSAVPQMNFLPAESLLLPLSEDGETIDKILASTISVHRLAIA